MDLNLNNKTALITGGSRGIGLAIAMTLAHEGCKIILNARDETKLHNAAKQFAGEVDIYATDIVDEDECAKLATYIKKKYGSLDILIQNVGSGRSVPPGEETQQEWRRILDLNLISTTTIVKALQDVITQGSGTVLCVSSICGQEALGAPLTYSAAKAALNSYIKGMARVLGNKAIRINAIAPGNILDEGGTWERKLGENRLSVETMLDKEVALKRLGTPQEIADFATFLVSEKASFATGAIFTVDGGQVRS